MAQQNIIIGIKLCHSFFYYHINHHANKHRKVGVNHYDTKKETSTS